MEESTVTTVNPPVFRSEQESCQGPEPKHEGSGKSPESWSSKRGGSKFPGVPWMRWINFRVPNSVVPIGCSIRMFRIWTPIFVFLLADPWKVNWLWKGKETTEASHGSAYLLWSGRGNINPWATKAIGLTTLTFELTKLLWHIVWLICSRLFGTICLVPLTMAHRHATLELRPGQKYGGTAEETAARKDARRGATVDLLCGTKFWLLSALGERDSFGQAPHFCRANIRGLVQIWSLPNKRHSQQYVV